MRGCPPPPPSSSLALFFFPPCPLPRSLLPSKNCVPRHCETVAFDTHCSRQRTKLLPGKSKDVCAWCFCSPSSLLSVPRSPASILLPAHGPPRFDQPRLALSTVGKGRPQTSVAAAEELCWRRNHDITCFRGQPTPARSKHPNTATARPVCGFQARVALFSMCGIPEVTSPPASLGGPCLSRMVWLPLCGPLLAVAPVSHAVRCREGLPRLKGPHCGP